MHSKMLRGSTCNSTLENAAHFLVMGVPPNDKIKNQSLASELAQPEFSFCRCCITRNILLKYRAYAYRRKRGKVVFYTAGYRKEQIVQKGISI